MKKIITAIMGILLISIVSAEIIRIEPETLEPLQIHSGETILQNITIITDGNYLVFVDYEITNNTHNLEGFSINLPEFIFVEREKMFQIEMSTVPLFKPDSFVIHFIASTEGIQAKSIAPSRGGGRTRIIEKNITKYVNNTIEISKEIEVIREIENTEKIEEQEKSIKRLKILLGVLLGILVLVILIIGILIKTIVNKKVKIDEPKKE